MAASITFPLPRSEVIGLLILREWFDVFVVLIYQGAV